MEHRAISTFKTWLVPVGVIIGLGLVLFLPAGTLRFWQAWIYLAIFSIITLFMLLYFFKKSPELLIRRSDFRKDDSEREIPSWLKLFLLMYLVPGFDFRFHWSDVPVWLVISANLMVFLGYLFILLVFNENSYASAVIKLEKEQAVITTGPYAFVRHPMYTGMLMMTLFTPVALGSYWALVPCSLFLPWLYLRIKNEEKALINGLPGYREYCARVRYRLCPYIW
ncbi:MAG: isoprenylcysteine carboxylmethyltransferase family protein [Bacteroidales bacterium]